MRPQPKEDMYMKKMISLIVVFALALVLVRAITGCPSIHIAVIAEKSAVCSVLAISAGRQGQDLQNHRV